MKFNPNDLIHRKTQLTDQEFKMLHKIKNEFQVSDSDALDLVVANCLYTNHLLDHIDFSNKRANAIIHKINSETCDQIFLESATYETDCDNLFGACISSFTHNLMNLK